MAGSNFDDSDGFFDRVLNSTAQQSRFWARRSFWGAILMTIALLTLVSVIWLSYINAPDAPPEDSLPIIQADDAPFRITPEEPGGMDIPNQESTIFDITRGLETHSESGSRVEDLFAPAEEETALPTREEMLARAGLLDEAADEEEETTSPNDDLMARVEELAQAARDTENQLDETELEKPTATATATVDENGLPVQGSFPEPRAAQNPEDTLNYVRSVLDRNLDSKDLNTEQQTEAARTLVTEKTAPRPQEKPKAAISAAPVVPASGPDRFVQFGSFKEREAATQLWTKLQSDFPETLGALNLRVQEADLGDRGIYYRTQAGPVPESQAKEVCKTVMVKRPNGCLVVKP